MHRRVTLGLAFGLSLSGSSALGDPPTKIEALLSGGYEVKAAAGNSQVYLQKGPNLYMCEIEYDSSKSPRVSGYFVGQCTKLASR